MCSSKIYHPSILENLNSSSLLMDSKPENQSESKTPTNHRQVWCSPTPTQTPPIEEPFAVTHREHTGWLRAEGGACIYKRGGNHGWLQVFSPLPSLPSPHPPFSPPRPSPRGGKSITNPPTADEPYPPRGELRARGWRRGPPRARRAGSAPRPRRARPARRREGLGSCMG